MEFNKEELIKLLAEKEEYMERCKTELIAVSGQIQLIKELLGEKV